MPSLETALDLGIVKTSFADGLLMELHSALRSTARGELFAMCSRDPGVREGLDRWARITQNSIVEISEEPAGTRYVIRNGAAPPEEKVAFGERIWLYANFDCNLACDYCCVGSSPKAERRALGLETVRQIAPEARALGIRQIFVTGGEPLLLPDIAELLAVCTRSLPTTVLTNGILLLGRRLKELDVLDRKRLCFQISVDSPGPALHDAHRGPGSWDKAMRGIARAREAGFRVRWAATVSNDAQAQEFREFLDRNGVALEDRVIRPVARRGMAESGVVLSRADLAPELTVTARGLFWHPVGVQGRDLFVTAEILPLAKAFEALRRNVEREYALHQRLLKVFHCA